MKTSQILILAAAALILILFFALDLGHFLSLEALKGNHQRLLLLYHRYPVAVVSGFAAIYILQTALALPGAAMLSLAAGAIFGTLAGTIVTNVAATVGATAAFLVSRFALRDVVERRFGHRLTGMNRELEQRGLNYLLFLRMVPVFPFFLINLGAGLTRLPLTTFTLGTMIGIIPGGFLYVNAGAGLATITSPGDVLSPRVLGSLALLGVFALIPAVYMKSKERSR